MEITPELIANYEFSTSMRGFDADEVNDFLEKVGTELAKTQHQLRKATERIATLEAQLSAAQASQAGADASSEADARRAAKALMAAQETAERIEAEAAAEAAQLTNDALIESTEMRAAAEREVETIRQQAAAESSRLQAELADEAADLKAKAIAEVESVRNARIAELEAQISSLTNLSGDLQADTAALEHRVMSYRALIESMATMFRELLDDDDALYTQPEMELRVAVPSSGRTIDRPAEHITAPPSEQWERGTWSPDLPAGVEVDEPLEAPGEYPLGAETTEVDVVDIDSAFVGAVDGVDLFGHDDVDSAEAGPDVAAGNGSGAVDHLADIELSESDPTMGEGWKNPFDGESPIPEPGNPWRTDDPPTDDHVAIGSMDETPFDSGAFDSGDHDSGAAEMAYTAEFDAIDIDETDDEPASDSRPRQLQAFAGEVDAFQTLPYVPKQVFAEGGHGTEFDAPPMDLAGDAFAGGFSESDYDFEDFATSASAMPTTQMPITRGRDLRTPSEALASDDAAFDDGAFSTNYGASDRYLQELDDAVNGEDDDLESLNAFLATNDPVEETPKRRFRRR